MGTEMGSRGVAWAGQTPQWWGAEKVKNIAYIGVGKTPPTGDEKFFGGGIPWVTIGDMDHGKALNLETKQTLSAAGIAATGIIPAKAGSVLISFKLSVGKAVMADCDVYTNEAIASFLAKQNTTPEYLFWALPIALLEAATENIYGAKILNQDKIRQAEIPLPPLNEQKLIAVFLGDKTDNINREIEILTRKIDLLREQRKAIIFEAVTKGLDRDAPMKDSGVDWIGSIPEHWRITPLKLLFNPRNERNVRADGTPKTENILSVMKDIGVINYNDKGNVGNKKSEDVTGYKVVHTSDIVINKMNVIIGSCGISREYGALSVVYIVLSSRPEIEAEYAKYLFSNKHWQVSQRAIATGIMEIRESVNTDRFFSQPLPVPPKHQQSLIVSHLDRITKNVDMEIRLLTRKIDLLSEQRKALIFEAVTGKIDLSNYQPRPTQN